MDANLSIQDKIRIRAAWLWMKLNHPLIKELNVDEPSDLTDATETLLEYNAEAADESANMSRLEAFHMGPVGTGGPTTADEANNLANLTFGLLGRDQEVVKYSNPRLLGYLFPTLYPSGQGFFSLDYSGVKRGCNGEIEVFEVKDINYRNDQASVQDLSLLSEDNSDGSTSDARSVDEPSDDQDQIENPEAEYVESDVDSDSSDNE
ncbi:hypothetical protein BC939DRAFT_462526, partial [Gamsiella multidivaricata]|uniref:uncharacterized protein n=1 Tax=Gamsiella multidivaricata TaxID=101098 RepID=UPI00221F412A